MALTCTDMSDAVAGSDAEGLTADAIVVGAGLAGLVAACELADRGLRVLILDQENRANVGGQAFWSFGGLFWSTVPSSAAWASVIAMSLLCRIGWGRRRSTGPRTTGPNNGRMLTSISRRGRSAAGCGPAG